MEVKIISPFHNNYKFTLPSPLPPLQINKIKLFVDTFNLDINMVIDGEPFFPMIV